MIFMVLGLPYFTIRGESGKDNFSIKCYWYKNKHLVNPWIRPSCPVVFYKHLRKSSHNIA